MPPRTLAPIFFSSLPPMTAQAALAVLAATPTRDLPRAAAPSGARPVRALATRLTDAGLARWAGDGGGADAASADVAALHAVFDGALAGGLACYVLDYVVEVCGDPLMTSR